MHLIRTGCYKYKRNNFTLLEKKTRDIIGDFKPMVNKSLLLPKEQEYEKDGQLWFRTLKFSFKITISDGSSF